jgi:Zn ribbon nucleic-acid-binding protein
MEEDQNATFEISIDCPKCHTAQNVKLLSVTNNESYTCTQCAHSFDLSQLDPEADKRKKKNASEFDKLRKLLNGDQ